MYLLERRNIARHIYSITNSLRKTARLCQVSHSTISRWINNPIKKLYTKPNKIYKSIQIIDIIKLSIINDPFISILKLKELISDTLKINVSKELIRIAIKRQGFTKKVARFYGEPITLPEKTRIFLELRNKYIDENKIFVSIDALRTTSRFARVETSFGRNGTISKGYSKKGNKLFIKKQKPRITTTSVIAAFTMNELIGRIDITGSVNTDLFVPLGWLRSRFYLKLFSDFM
jgi:transposase